jgi:hypothetical protein
MPESINWTLNVQVVGGPKISDSKTLEVEAYDKIQVVIEATGNPVEVEIQPSITEGQVKFLMISLTDSNTYGNQVIYTVNDPPDENNSSDPKQISLDAPQLLIGKGGVKLLDSAPQRLYFKNELDEEISVQILVGRDAIPQP